MSTKNFNWKDMLMPGAATEPDGLPGWFSKRTNRICDDFRRIFSEQRMRRLAELLDGGNLETGAFHRRNPQPHHIIRVIRGRVL